jgi:hypothetical protein
MPFEQSLTGLIEPNDTTFKGASLEDRQWLYSQASAVVLDRLRIQLSRAIGRTGRVMKPRIMAVLPDGSDGPVMTPHDDLSRAIQLADCRTSSRSLVLYWKPGLNHPDAHAARARHARKNLKHLGGKGPGSRGGGKATPFDEVLQYHADGLVRGAPVRDVRLSAASIAQVKLAVAKLWRERVSDRARTAQPPQPPQPPLHLPEPAPTPPREVPPGIAATGRTDLNFFTFGIGGGKDLAERAIASGHFTGFRKLGPRPPTAPGGVPLPVQPKSGSAVTAKAIAPHAVPLPRVAMPPALAGHAVPLSHVSLPVQGAMPHAVPLRMIQVVPEPESSPDETTPPFGT